MKDSEMIRGILGDRADQYNPPQEVMRKLYYLENRRANRVRYALVLILGILGFTITTLMFV